LGALGQLDVRTKSALTPEKVIERSLLEKLYTVNVCEADGTLSGLVKFRENGDVTRDAVVAVPVKLAVAVFPDPSVATIVPVRTPEPEVGWKVMLTVQVLFTGTLTPQVVAVIWKSAALPPPRATVMTVGTVPTFLTVITCGVYGPTLLIVTGKVKEAGLKLRVPRAVPIRLNVSVL